MAEQAIDPSQRDEQERKTGKTQMLGEEIGDHGTSISQPVGGHGSGSVVERGILR